MKIIVTNKLTYLWLITPLIAVIKFLGYDLLFLHTSILTFGFQLLLSMIIAFIGVYFFISFNSYSNWTNPNHPKE